MLDDLLDRFHRGDRLALSRLVSLVAAGEQVDAILAGAGRPHHPARVIAVTGSGGVGKSTLIGKIIDKARENVHKVAVLACDPQSPLTGGALLGDRFRMSARPDDDGVFIRSLAAPGGSNALADNIEPLIRLLEVFGFELILIETVGAGQGDTAVRELADVVVLLLQPEMGDDLQWEKAGVLEVADLIVIHKADFPGADRVEAQVLATLGLAPGAAPPVLGVSSRTGVGLDKLGVAIDRLPLRRQHGREGTVLLRAAQQALAERFRHAVAGAAPNVGALLASWKRGELDTRGAAAALLKALAEQQNSHR